MTTGETIRRLVAHFGGSTDKVKVAVADYKRQHNCSNSAVAMDELLAELDKMKESVHEN